MPSYSYKATKRDGTLVQGSLDAPSEALVGRELRSQGLVVLLVSSEAGSASVHQRRGRFDRSQVLSFTSELAVMLRAGLPIDRALKVLIDMAAQPASRDILQDVLTTVKGGKGLSQALADKPDLFDDFYVSMIRSGEASGNLADVLTRLSAQLERSR